MVVHHEVVVIPDSPSPPSSPSHQAVPPLQVPPADADRIFDDFDWGNDFDVVALDKTSYHQPEAQAVSGYRAVPGVVRPPVAQDEQPPSCDESVLHCFPDICPKFLQSQTLKHEGRSHDVISDILDELEKGRPYPKRLNRLKRKRPEEEEDKEETNVTERPGNAEPRPADRGRDYFNLYLKTSKLLLRAAFPQRYVEDIDNVFRENDYRVYTTYLALDEANWNPKATPARTKKVGPGLMKLNSVEIALRRNVHHSAEMDALATFTAVRTACETKARARETKELEERLKVEEEERNLAQAKAEGTVADCGCCFEELPLNRMVHCDASTVHWFCRACAKQMAEHVIGLSKHKLACMSMDGCEGGFAKDQRDIFLDSKMTTALDLIEQEEALRLAGIENLETCPFCRYAAEYPPIEQNKEFRCENSECLQVSCRLCRLETHIPKTCQEAARENGHSARRAIEEAMSAALIRKCNKCGTPFIKENGCNKMTCTRGGCYNVQCYVCSKSCDYRHFDDSTRGGKKGNCPLFDSVEQRHQSEVRAAEELARQQAAEQNPELAAELLEIHFSDEVHQDDERRKAANPAVVPGRVFPPPVPPGWVPPGINGQQPNAPNRAPHIAHIRGVGNNQNRVGAVQRNVQPQQGRQHPARYPQPQPQQMQPVQLPAPPVARLAQPAQLSPIARNSRNHVAQQPFQALQPGFQPRPPPPQHQQGKFLAEFYQAIQVAEYHRTHKGPVHGNVHHGRPPANLFPPVAVHPAKPGNAQGRPQAEALGHMNAGLHNRPGVMQPGQLGRRGQANQVAAQGGQAGQIPRPAAQYQHPVSRANVNQNRPALGTPWWPRVP